MTWIDFPLIALITAALWVASSALYAVPTKNKLRIALANTGTIAGITVLLTFIVLLWQHLERPPMRTLGETRLWYALFMSIVGFIIFLRWRKRWYAISALVVIGGMMFSILFLTINYIHPENYDKTLMPALQSPWFVPHVVVYIFAYAILGLSMVVAIVGLVQKYFYGIRNKNILIIADNLVYVGVAFLTLGLLFGALWAKEAWGHYWTWDPKETWAFLTWVVYLIYIHLRFFQPRKHTMPLWIVSLAFVVLLVCWFGINYLAVGANSVHTYSS